MSTSPAVKRANEWAAPKRPCAVDDPTPPPWPRIRVRRFNRIRRRARMSASPTCERSSPRQRSSPALACHCLLLWSDGKLQREPHRQDRKRALPLRRRSRAAAHAAVGDKTSQKLLAPVSLHLSTTPRGTP